MACDSRLLDSESRNRAMQTIATNVEEALHVKHQVQCVLMINMFNEKIFLFLWFWYFLLAGATVCSLFYWVFISTVPSRQLNFVGKYLTGIEGYKMVDSQSLRRFVFHFLRQDGVFLLRMVATHAGELPCYELAKNSARTQCHVINFALILKTKPRSLGVGADRSVYIVKAGYKFIVACEYNGDEVADEHSVQWINEASVPIEPSISILTQARQINGRIKRSLIFVKIQKHDAGEYKCRAELRNGEFVTRSIHVIVLSSLFKITNSEVTIEQLTKEHQGLKLRCLAVQTINVNNEFNTTTTDVHELVEPPKQPTVSVEQVSNSSIIFRIVENREDGDLPVLSYSIIYTLNVAVTKQKMVTQPQQVEEEY
uniref:Innexin n=1 Tax=Ditylenchus dipsaci TaxID=166011 RepID=A0A915E4N9_9BILA